MDDRRARRDPAPVHARRPRAPARRGRRRGHGPRPDALELARDARRSSRRRPRHPFIAGVVGWVDLTDPGSPTTSPGSARCRVATGSSGSATRSTTSPIRPGCGGRTSGGASPPSPPPASPTTSWSGPRELPAAARHGARPAAGPVRPRPSRQAADRRDGDALAAWAHALRLLAALPERRRQALRARHRGRLDVLDRRRPRRPDPRRARGVRPGAAALRLGLAGLPRRRLVPARRRRRRRGPGSARGSRARIATACSARTRSTPIASSVA